MWTVGKVVELSVRDKNSSATWESRCVPGSPSAWFYCLAGTTTFGGTTHRAVVAKLANAPGCQPGGLPCPCGFDSRPPHTFGYFGWPFSLVQPTILVHGSPPDLTAGENLGAVVDRRGAAFLRCPLALNTYCRLQIRTTVGQILRSPHKFRDPRYRIRDAEIQREKEVAFLPSLFSVSLFLCGGSSALWLRPTAALRNLRLPLSVSLLLFSVMPLSADHTRQAVPHGQISTSGPTTGMISADTMGETNGR